MPWVNVTDVLGVTPSRKELAEIEEYARRKKKPRFYADENFPAQATAILREWGFKVFTVQEANRRGHPDETHLAEARRGGRILLTCDRDYLNERRFPLIHCSTVVVFDFGSGSRADIVQAFQCLDIIMRAPQFYDTWTKIDATPNEWTEIARFRDGTTARERRRFFQGMPQVWVDQ